MFDSGESLSNEQIADGFFSMPSDLITSKSNPFLSNDDNAMFSSNAQSSVNSRISTDVNSGDTKTTVDEIELYKLAFSKEGNVNKKLKRSIVRKNENKPAVLKGLFIPVSVLSLSNDVMIPFDVRSYLMVDELYQKILVSSPLSLPASRAVITYLSSIANYKLGLQKINTDHDDMLELQRVVRTLSVDYQTYFSSYPRQVLTTSQQHNMITMDVLNMRHGRLINKALNLITHMIRSFNNCTQNQAIFIISRYISLVQRAITLFPDCSFTHVDLSAAMSFNMDTITSDDELEIFANNVLLRNNLDTYLNQDNTIKVSSIIDEMCLSNAPLDMFCYPICEPIRLSDTPTFKVSMYPRSTKYTYHVSHGYLGSESYLNTVYLEKQPSCVLTSGGYDTELMPFELVLLLTILDSIIKLFQHSTDVDTCGVFNTSAHSLVKKLSSKKFKVIYIRLMYLLSHIDTVKQYLQNKLSSDLVTTLSTSNLSIQDINTIRSAIMSMIPSVSPSYTDPNILLEELTLCNCFMHGLVSMNVKYVPCLLMVGGGNNTIERNPIVHRP